MKKLYILSIVTVVSISAAGCKSCAGWWPWNRGAACDPCNTYETGIAPPDAEIYPGTVPPNFQYVPPAPAPSP
jgi:hypothetical protein